MAKRPMIASGPHRRRPRAAAELQDAADVHPGANDGTGLTPATSPTPRRYERQRHGRHWHDDGDHDRYEHRQQLQRAAHRPGRPDPVRDGSGPGDHAERQDHRRPGRPAPDRPGPHRRGQRLRRARSSAAKRCRPRAPRSTRSPARRTPARATSSRCSRPSARRHVRPIRVAWVPDPGKRTYRLR